MKELLHKSMKHIVVPFYEPSRHVYSMFVDTVKLCIFQLVTGKEKISIFFRILDVQGKKSTGD